MMIIKPRYRYNWQTGEWDWVVPLDFYMNNCARLTRLIEGDENR